MSVDVFGRRVQPGERVKFRAKVAEQNDGSDVTVPVAVICGKADGPVVLLMGAQHGDEYSGWSVFSLLLPTISPDTLRGTVIGLPITCPFAFFGESRVNTFDYEFLNFNRIWPGDPSGFLSQRMADTIFRECVTRANYVVDFHEGGRDFLARYLSIGGSPVVRSRVGDQKRQLAVWFGHGIPVREYEMTAEAIRLGRGGTIHEAAGQIGIPALTVELGGGGTVWEEFQRDGVAGARNILIGLEMLSGEMAAVDRPQAVMHTCQWVRPSHGGFLVNDVKLGDVVTAGAPLGRLLDPYGDLVEVLTAPFRSVILDTRFTTAMHPGDWAFQCGRLDP